MGIGEQRRELKSEERKELILKRREGVVRRKEWRLEFI